MLNEETLGLNAVIYHPIGVVRTPFGVLEGIPKQAFDAPMLQGSVEIEPHYRAGLADLEGFSHLLLLAHLHRSGEPMLVVGAGRNGVRRGVFATRNQRRPNAIGLSVVRLLRIRGDGFEFAGVDLLDGTPLLDVKPYVPAFDARPNARIGWLTDRAELGRPPPDHDLPAE